MSKKEMNQKDVVRIQKATVKANEGITPKKSFAAKAQSIVDKKSK